MPKPLQTSGNKRFIDGYSDDIRNAGPNHLTPPSVNVDITKTGEAVYRKGITATSFDLDEAGNGSRPFHVPRYNVTFFSINGKVLFVNHNNSDAVVDTGVSLTETDGRKTRFGEYAGDIYFTNRTDGLRQIHMARANGASSASSPVINLDQDFIGRLLAFSDGTGTLRIANSTPYTEAYAITTSGNVSGAANNGAGLIRITTDAAHTMQTGVSVTIASVGGTTEANGTWTVTVIDATNFDLQGSSFANAYTSGGTWTYNPNGVFPVTGTLNADVADNTIVYTIEDISSGRPKASGITFWKERMILWGVVNDTAVDSPTNTVYMSKFATLVDLQNIIDFDTTGTAAKEMVGKGGTVTNVLSTRDYLYMFTETETYYSSVADVNITTGGTLPQLLSNQYGCINEDCAADLGNGLCAFMTKNSRFMGIRIESESGAPVVFPDEQFDSPISNTVKLLDADQSSSFFFYAPNDHKLYAHCDVDTERIVQKFNTEIQKWEPPTTGWSMGGMYVRDGVTYATELTEDTVYQCNDGFQDDGIDYEVVMATSLIESEDGRTTLALDNYGISGRIGALTTVTAESVVGGGTAQQKSFTAGASVTSGTLGSVSVGSTTLGSGIGEEMEEYDKLFGIYPKYGQSLQIRVRSLANVSGGAFSLSSYTVHGRVLSKPLLTLQ